MTHTQTYLLFSCVFLGLSKLDDLLKRPWSSLFNSWTSLACFVMAFIP